MIGSLTNHLWQSTFFALAAALLTLAFRRNRAKVRYAIWLSASVKFLIPFSLFVSFGSEFQWTPAARRIATQIPAPAVSLRIEQISQPFPADGRLPITAQNDIGWTPLIAVTIWLWGLLTIACLRFAAWRRIRSEVRISARLDLKLPESPMAVEARLSRGFLEPGVVGVWRPILLLPKGIMERLTPAELRAVIAHELCHVRRRDNLFATVQMAVEAMFWFHPLVWWIGARLVEERERACDEDVVSLGNRPDVYAGAIIGVCKLYADSPLACVSGVTGADIRRRIEAIMSTRAHVGLSGARKCLLALAGISAVMGPVVMGVLIGIGHAPAIRAQLPAPRPVQDQLALVAQASPAPQVQSPEPETAPKPPLLPEQKPSGLTAQAAPAQPLHPAQPHPAQPHPAQILTSSRGQDSSMAMCIIIDNSGSMRGKRAAVMAAALALVKASKPDDDVCMIDFNDEVFGGLPKGEDFTGDIGEMEEALTHIDSRGGRAMRDAVWLSIEIAQTAHHDSKALVLITEGNDTASKVTQEQLISKIRSSGVRVYCIGLTSEDDPRRAGAARVATGQLADASGGLAYYPKDLAEVESIAPEIAHEIRKQ